MAGILNLIDTSAMYQGSQELIGNPVRHRRDRNIRVSTCGTQAPHAPDAACGAELIRHTVDAALKRLRTDRIDVMLLHSCDLTALRNQEPHCAAFPTF